MARKRRRQAWGLAAGLGVLAGCEPSEGAQEAEGSLLLATLDTHHFCDMDPVVAVRLRALWQACPAVQADCEPPQAESAVVEGDRFTCPATDAQHDLGVRLFHPGRYRIEAVAELTTGRERLECFVDPDTGDLEIELPEDRLWSEARGQTPVVLDEHEPCPP